MDRGNETASLPPAGERAVVGDLVYRYARLVRERQGHQCLALFADEASYEIREADPLGDGGESRLRTRLDGAAAIADYVGASSLGAVRLFPLIHNLMVELSGNTARSNCLMMSKTFPAGNEVFGVYDDAYVCRDGVWLFASRTYTILDAPWTRAVAP